MPVRLLIGPNGSGGTARILEAFKRFAPSEHQASVRLIVPSVSQVIRLRKLILSDPDYPGLLGDPICTFTRFAGDIVAETNADPPGLITDPQRLLILKDLIRTMPGGYFDRVMDCPSLPREIGRVIGMLRDSGIGPDDLARRASGLPENSRRKLTGIADVYRAYQEAVRGRNLSAPEDLIRRASGALSPIRCVMLDGFSAFTSAERELVKAACERCGEVVIALEYDAGRPGVYSDVEPALVFLQRLPNVMVEQLKVGHEASALGHLKSNLFAERPPRTIPDDSVAGLIAADARMQIEGVANEIVRLIHEKGYRASDIVVVTRSMRDHGRIASGLREHRIAVADEVHLLSESSVARGVLGRLGSPDLDPRAVLRDIPRPEDEEGLPGHFAACKSIRRIMDGIEGSEDAIGRKLAREEFAAALRAGVESGVYRVPGEVEGVSLVTAGSLDGREFGVVFVIGDFAGWEREDPFVNEWEREALGLQKGERARAKRLFLRAVGSARERLYLCSIEGEELRDVGELFSDEYGRRVCGAGDVVTMEDAHTRGQLISRFVRDCHSSGDEKAQRMAPAAYNAMLETGILGPRTLEWLDRDYPETAGISDLGLGTAD